LHLFPKSTLIKDCITLHADMGLGLTRE